jgi:TolA-binding protein
MSQQAGGEVLDTSVVADAGSSITNGINALLGQFTLLINTPPVQGTQQIMAAIHQMQQNMDTRFQQIDDRFQQMDDRFQQIDGRFQQMDDRFQQLENRTRKIENESTNREIGTMNAILFRNSQLAHLQALYNVQTGEPIPNFPSRHSELEHLTGIYEILPLLISSTNTNINM